jgi:delta-1-pyrroline-5-carboxylate synthetase
MSKSNYDFISTARHGSRVLQKLPAEDRANAINALADLLISKQADILEANEKDIAQAIKEETAAPLISRLSLTPSKLKSLATGKTCC